jgi:prepilin-type N-terminal cleavage/methylation domain-containing protein
MRKAHKSRGFTLMEIIVSMAIMATAVTVLIQLFGGAMLSGSLSKDYSEAVRLAGNVLERALNDDELNADYEKSGSIDEGFTWQVEADEYILPEFSQEIETPMKTLLVVATVRWAEKKIDLWSLKLIQE